MKNLLAKWLSRKKCIIRGKDFTKDLQKHLNLTPKEYRKLIVSNSNTLEQQMTKKEWSEINYSQVPSVASNKYRKAFYRNDEERYTKFIEKVTTGEEKINASAIFPYDLYRAYSRGDNTKSIDAQWSNLPNYMTDTNKQILPVCDVSGSMSGTPMDISVSLGVYLSERNRGIFKDAFITFSHKPVMQVLKGSTCSRFAQLERADWEGNTDLNKVFELILNSAIRESLPESEMPNMLLIISDMEFDSCGTLTNYENIELKYSQAGYKIPEIIFWNVNSRSNNLPVSKNDKNVALISGASPSIVKSVLTGEISPIAVMNRTLNSERYDRVVV